MKKTVFLIIILSVLVTVSCSSHYKKGVKAYQDQEYSEAVSELNQVEKADDDYLDARLVLRKSQFRLLIKNIKFNPDPQSKEKQLGEMISMALLIDAKEITEETFNTLLTQLRESKDPVYIKKLLNQLVQMVKEKGDLDRVSGLIKELFNKVKEFLFNSDMRSTFKNTIKDLKNLVR